LGAGGVFGRNVVLLDEPFLFQTRPAGIYVGESMAPGNSWVKINVDDQAADEVRRDSLIFYYIWTNPTGRHTIVDVSAYMTVSGSWEVEGHLWGKRIPYDPNDPNADPSDPQYEYHFGSARLGIAANLGLYQWWTQPPTLAPLQNVPDQQTQISLLDVDSSAGASADYSDSIVVSGFLFNFFELKQRLLVIPPEGTLVAEVSFDLDHRLDHGHVVADFASGEGNQVTSHWVQIEYVVAPPLTVTPFAVPPPARSTG
jgi:hypothetical protein